MPQILEDQRARAILRAPAAAAYVGLTTSTLAKRRLRGERPRFIRLGRKSIGYHIDELNDWLRECERSSAGGDGS